MTPPKFMVLLIFIP